MRKILAAILFLPLLAAAQPGNFPPLVGARGTSNPTNCAVGQLFFRSDVTAGQNIYGCTTANTWTAQGAAGAPAYPVTITGGVSGGIPYFSSTTVESASALLAQYGIVTGGGAGNPPYTTSGFTFGANAGEGLLVPAGTATTNVPALSVTRTNSNAAVATGVKFTFTDTTSAAGFLPFQVLGGSAGTSNLFSVDKAGGIAAGIGIFAINGSTGQVVAYNNASIGFASGTVTSSSSPDVGISRITSSVLAVGQGSGGGNATGTLAATNYRIGATNPVILGTAPTVASGGCTSPTAVTSNGTAAFSVGVGTGCAGSQPLVFTLPAATTGWICNGRNSSNAAISSPRQTGAVSTTSVTITNFAETTGLAAAWTDSDNVVISCMGY